ncbi:MAG TPA: hypothetical protein PKV86_05465 [Syntrophobacteraceae bacterium]|nr:hypothetical protein [Syntrophobacteraceae bacterium]
MMKKLLVPERVKKINGSFAFIEHRFLRDGFLASLSHQELLLYLFLVLAADRHGLSYYSFDRICTLLQMATDDYIEARNGLIDKDLLAFDGYLFQVLSLPQAPLSKPLFLLKTREDMERHDPATIRQICWNVFGEKS